MADEDRRNKDKEIVPGMKMEATESDLVAIPVLLASTTYAVAGSFGWPAALAKRPWQNEGFYLVLTAATIVSV
jgi:hypothetical protein